jgi:hypothetical protein
VWWCVVVAKREFCNNDCRADTRRSTDNLDQEKSLDRWIVGRRSLLRSKKL